MIALDLSTLHQSRENGNVTGVIYVELGSAAFPEKGWSDFPVIILSWWIEAFLELETPARRKVQWNFMDGPHSLTLTKEIDSLPGGALTFRQVESGLLEAAKQVVAYCEQHEMFSQDLETLRDNVRRLRANQPAAPNPAITIQFSIEHHCRRVGERHRSMAAHLG